MRIKLSTSISDHPLKFARTIFKLGEFVRCCVLKRFQPGDLLLDRIQTAGKIRELRSRGEIPLVNDMFHPPVNIRIQVLVHADHSDFSREVIRSSSFFARFSMVIFPA